MSRQSSRSRQVSDDSRKQSDASEGEDEITRCVCGQDELNSVDSKLAALLSHEYKIKIDQGLFIQCDQCLVWQHGYCVGLFISADVPDKYWCEKCKPDLHRAIEVDGRVVRTLYRPVNDTRTALIANETGDERPDTRERRSRRSPPPEDATRQARHDRRHADDAYDAQLQRALRESRVSSGTSASTARSGSGGGSGGSGGSGSERKRSADEEPTDKRHHTDELGRESNVDESEGARRERPRPRARAKPKKAPARRGGTPKNDAPAPSKDELLNQLSRPRYVNERSTIYELRKRTGAILEWLGRTQMELEEEREAKAVQVEAPMAQFDENLRLMASLTEKILAWEQRFGKYAP